MKYSKPLQVIADRMRERLNDRSTVEQRRIHSLADGLAFKVKALEDIAANRSPSETDAAHVKRLAQSAKRLEKAREEAEAKAHEIYSEASTSLTDQMNRAAGLIPSKYEAEIRQAVRGMSSEQRTDFMNQALKEGNSEVMAAVIDAPAVLSGINPELQGRYRESMWQSKAPELYKAMENTGDMFSEILTVTHNVGRAVQEGFDPAELGKIEAAEAAHADANRRFEAGDAA